MPDIKNTYGTSSDITITLASLASDTNLLIGRQSAVLDNRTARNLDFLVGGKITAGTSPTASRSIEVWAVGSADGVNFPDVWTDAGDAAKTATSADIKASSCRLIAAMATDATSNRSYHFPATSVAAAFGGTLPPEVVIWVVHSTGVALNATAANHLLRVTPVYRTVS